MALPNFVIAGVNKAGTTSLWSYLAQHPGVGASAVKETCYWLPVRYAGEALEPIEAYEKQFAGHGAKPVRMESTPGYFYGGKAVAEAIDAACPGVKVVVVLREPVSRAVSFYTFRQTRTTLPGDLAFAEYVERCRAMSGDALTLRANNDWFGVEGGRYAAYLPGWAEVFGAERLKVLWFDELVADPRAVVRGLCEWLEVDAGFADTFDPAATNQTAGYRNATLQRLALGVNMLGERFFRRHPGVKRRLRGAYARVNGKAVEKPRDPAALDALRAYYAEQNAELPAQLRSLGVTEWPAWVDGRPATQPSPEPKEA